VTIETARSLKVHRLYHYQSFQIPERLAQILMEQKIYFSTPAHLNDPWDCRPFFQKSNLDHPDERERVIHWFAEVDEKYNKHLSGAQCQQTSEKLRNDPIFLEAQIDQLTARMYESVKEQYRIYCLSRHPDCPLMWAHYSDSCRGFCLEFSSQLGFFCEALKVKYQDAYPHLDPTETDDLENAGLFVRKSAAWEYEGEFRLIVTQHPYVFGSIPQTTDGFVALSPGTLQSIILGPMMSSKDKELIVKLAKSGESRIQLKEAVVLPDRYGLRICEFPIIDGTHRSV
jgi:hypothetical protein